MVRACTSASSWRPTREASKRWALRLDFEIGVTTNPLERRAAPRPALPLVDVCARVPDGEHELGFDLGFCFTCRSIAARLSAIGRAQDCAASAYVRAGSGRSRVPSAHALEQEVTERHGRFRTRSRSWAGLYLPIAARARPVATVKP